MFCRGQGKVCREQQELPVGADSSVRQGWLHGRRRPRKVGDQQSLKQVAITDANRNLGKDRRAGLMTRWGNKDNSPPSVYKIRRAPTVCRGGNTATGEARRGCVAREEAVHSTALLGRGWGEGHMELAIIQLHK